MPAVFHRAKIQWDRTFEKAQGPHHLAPAESACTTLSQDAMAGECFLEAPDYTKDFFDEGFDFDVGVGD